MRYGAISLFGLALLMAAITSLAFAGRKAAHAGMNCDTSQYVVCNGPTFLETDPVNGGVALSWSYDGVDTPSAIAIGRSTGAFCDDGTLAGCMTLVNTSVQVDKDGNLSPTGYTDTGLAPGESHRYYVCLYYPSPKTTGYGCSDSVGTAGGPPSGGQTGNSGGNSGGNAGGGGSAPPAGPHGCNPTLDPNQALIFMDIGFSGQCAALPVAAYPTAQSFGLPDKSLSSFEVGANVQLVICNDANFRGACSTYINDVDLLALPAQSGNGAQSSVDRSGRAVRPISGPDMQNDTTSSMCVQWRGTPPGTPCGPATAPATDPSVSNRSQTTLTITWTPGYSGTNQQVFCAPSSGTGSPCAAIEPHDATNYTFTGLQPDHLYPLQVCNIEEYGVEPDGFPGSLCSNVVNARTLPPAPSNLTVKSVSETGIALTWSTNISDSASQVTYTISRDGNPVMTGLVPVRIGGVATACPYPLYDPATGGANPACAPYTHPLAYPSSVNFTDSFGVTAPRYDYTVCAVDAQDDVVQACASVTAFTHTFQPNVSPNRIPIPGT